MKQIENLSDRMMIYNQRKIPKEKWRYGFRSSAATGCGWIATYNALCLLGYWTEPEELIRYYERRVPLLNGNFGTFLTNPAGYFRQKGFDVKTTSQKNLFNTIASESDICILFYFWRNGIRFGAHFIALHRDDQEFIGYNTYSNSDSADQLGKDLNSFLTLNHCFFPYLIGIKKKNSAE